MSADPKDNRLRSSVMIETEGRTFVIDTGPDFRQQMLRKRVSGITAALFTHEHKDHIAGLDDVRAFNFVQQKAIDIYASSNVQEAIRREFHYVFSETSYPGVPRLNLHQIDERPFLIEGIKFIPIQVYHYKMPVLGFRTGDFTYITDANKIPESEKEKIKNSKILVLNALRKEHHLSHYTLEEAVALMLELKPERGFFTHISHQMGLHEEVEKELPGFLHLAYDGLTVEL